MANQRIRLTGFGVSSMLGGVNLECGRMSVCNNEKWIESLSQCLNCWLLMCNLFLFSNGEVKSIKGGRKGIIYLPPFSSVKTLKYDGHFGTQIVCEIFYESALSWFCSHSDMSGHWDHKL